MYAATANGTTEERDRAQPQITASSPNVATNSLKAWAENDQLARSSSAALEDLSQSVGQLPDASA